MIWIYITAAIIVGGFMPVQAGINAKLSNFLQNSYAATFVSFFMGTVFSGFVALAQKGSLPGWSTLSTFSPVYFLGGVLGVVFVFSGLFLFQKVGATTLMISFLSGQLIISLLIDHFGWFSVPIHEVSLLRIAGIPLLFLGIYLITKF